MPEPLSRIVQSLLRVSLDNSVQLRAKTRPAQFKLLVQLELQLSRFGEEVFGQAAR